jgi:hypothetical protein
MMMNNLVFYEITKNVKWFTFFKVKNIFVFVEIDIFRYILLCLLIIIITTEQQFNTILVIKARAKTKEKKERIWKESQNLSFFQKKKVWKFINHHTKREIKLQHFVYKHIKLLDGRFFFYDLLSIQYSLLILDGSSLFILRYCWVLFTHAASAKPQENLVFFSPISLKNKNFVKLPGNIHSIFHWIIMQFYTVIIS